MFLFHYFHFYASLNALLVMSNEMITLFSFDPLKEHSDS